MKCALKNPISLNMCLTSKHVRTKSAQNLLKPCEIYALKLRSCFKKFKYAFNSANMGAKYVCA